MKALLILKDQIKNMSADEAESFIKEAIEELEQLQKGSCYGCKYYVQIDKSNTFICSLNIDCILKKFYFKIDIKKDEE